MKWLVIASITSIVLAFLLTGMTGYELAEENYLLALFYFGIGAGAGVIHFKATQALGNEMNAIYRAQKEKDIEYAFMLGQDLGRQAAQNTKTKPHNTGCDLCDGYIFPAAKSSEQAQSPESVASVKSVDELSDSDSRKDAKEEP